MWWQKLDGHLVFVGEEFLPSGIAASDQMHGRIRYDAHVAPTSTYGLGHAYYLGNLKELTL